MKDYYACKNCKRIIKKKVKVCPYCGSKELTRNWQGMLIIIDPNCEIAKVAKITVPGEYAIVVK